MSAGDYLEGLVFAVLMAVAVLVGAFVLLHRRFPQLDGAARVAGFGVLATAGVLAVHLVPAAMEVLSRGTVLGAGAVWLLAASLIPAVRATPPQSPDPPPSLRICTLAAGAGAALLAVLALAIARDQLVLAPHSIDAITFHLPVVANWIQSGSIWQVETFVPDIALGNYPNNGDAILLAAVLPWRNDFLAHFAMYPFWALTGVATYALARELRTPRAVALLAGCVVLALPSTAVPALATTLVDTPMLFGLAAGMLFLIRHHRSGRTSELVLAGVALGISFGTKWYAVSSVPIVIAVWAGASLVAGRALRDVARQALALGGLIGLAGGVWLLRNLVISGNPVFPVKVAPFGVTIFDAPRDFIREQAGATIAGYLDQPSIWGEHILPAYRDALALPGALALAGIVVAVFILIAVPRRTSLPGRGLAWAGAACAVLLLIAYSFTPYSAGGPPGLPLLVGPDSRYAVPGLLVGAVLAAWAAARIPRGSPVFSLVALVAIIDGVMLTAGGDFSPAVPSTGDWLTAVAVAVAVAVGVWMAAAARQLLEPPHRTVVAASVATAIAVGVGVGGHEVQKRYNAKRYAGTDPVTDVLMERAAPGSRVGLAGIWDDTFAPILPAFGPRYRNHVEYVGGEVEEMLRRHATREEFVAALRRGDYDYLVVGRGRPGVPYIEEQVWALAAGYEQIAASSRYRLYRSASEGAAPR